MRVLISGAGIAGPTLAYWLKEYGHEPTIVERAPSLRTTGYIIDFWGAGFDIAERMGLLYEISRTGYKVQEVRVVNESGHRVAGFPAEVFSRVTGGRYVSIRRGDLAASIYGKIRDRVETLFGDSVVAIEQKSNCVRVTFERSPAREFDLVVGADGLHSKVRELVFGPENRFERYLGYRVAAFEAEGYRPRDELVYVMFTQLGQQVARFAMRDDRTLFLFTFADSNLNIESNNIDAQKHVLRERFHNSGWECPRILDALENASELYFDRVSQIRMSPDDGLWTRDRVTLVGDSGFCVSLLAGQGSALAMTAAYILAGELHRAGGDYRQAFSRYQEIFAPFVAAKQKAALRFAGFFAPSSRAGLFVRNRMMSLLTVSWIANLVFARDLKDNLVLPAY